MTCGGEGLLMSQIVFCQPVSDSKWAKYFSEMAIHVISSVFDNNN